MIFKIATDAEISYSGFDNFKAVKKLTKYLISLGAVAAATSFIAFFAPSFRSLQARTIIWENAIKLVNENPVFGAGLESFKIVFQKVMTKDLFEVEKFYQLTDRVHNEYLGIALSQGRFGFAIYIAAIILMFYLILKKRKRSTRLIISTCALIGILITNFFSFSLTTHWLVLMALFAIIINNTRKLKEIKPPLAVWVVLIAFTIFGAITSTRAIYADIKFTNAKNLIYQAQIDEGIEQIIQAANINTHQSKIYFFLSDALTAISEKTLEKEPIEKANKIIEYGGKFTNFDFQYLVRKAKIQTHLKNYDQAERLFEKAATLAPTNPIILKEWGKMYALKGDHKKAADKIEEFIDLIPEDIFKDAEKYRLFLKHAPDFVEVVSIYGLQ